MPEAEYTNDQGEHDPKRRNEREITWIFPFKGKKKRQKSKYEVTSQTHHHWARDVSTRSLSSQNIAIVFDSRAV